ncbi:Sad1/UNC-like protein [Hoeflea halophila]|uniref:Sad1/UNC-like protein n=1 Tax=Hoeflea halophila TaxID=714899 RepID=A0A286IEI1_9HYPH|nr:OmpA family protein [Hoeflea halophila]SOE18535.1 Sad1/UNC-like protein [Hoeflea halophila]
MITLKTRLLAINAFILLSFAATAHAEDAAMDWLNITNGAVLISATSQYDSGSNSGIAAISGNNRFTWYTAENDGGPQTLIYELAQRVMIERFVIDTSYEANSRAPKSGTLWGSEVSAAGPWKVIRNFEVDSGAGRNVFSVTGELFASRWLKFEIKSNWGSPQYTAITEFEAYGEQVGTIEHDTDLSGAFNSNYEKMWLLMDGTDVVGCYDWQNGTLTGDTDGRLFRFQWTEKPPQIGSAIMAISSDGSVFGGMFFEQGEVQGIWSGSRLTGGSKPNCQPKTNSVEDALNENNRAVLYGIHFDFDSAKLRSSAAPTLKLLKQALDSNPGWAVEIQGHTDSDGTDKYNLDLSDRRAASVLAWLASNGIEQSRLTSKGFGESVPASDNSSSQGRALNRRVEIVRAQ